MKRLLVVAAAAICARAPAQQAEVSVQVLDEQVGELSLGLGWNWEYIGGEFPDWSDTEWRAYHELLKWTGTRLVRYGLACDQWEPENDDADPNHFAWDRFTFDSDVMRKHYRNLDFCERNDIDVMLCNWHAGNGRSWLAETVHDPSLHDTDRQTTTDAPYSPAEFVETICALIHELKSVRHYRCVKYLSLWNEPNGRWAYNSPNARYPETFWDYYPLLDAKLKAMGLRDQIKIVAPDSSVQYNELPHILEQIKRIGPIPDVICDHDYQGYFDWRQGPRRGRLSEGITAWRALKDGLREEYGHDVPFLVGEFGNYGGGSGEVKGDEEIYLGSLSTSELVLRGAQAGVNGFLRWEYKPYAGGWRNFGALTSEVRDKVFIPYRPVYYPHALLCRWVPRGVAVRRTVVEGSEDAQGYERVWATGFAFGQGDMTLVMINDSDTQVEAAIRGMAGKPDALRFLYYDASLPETIQVGDRPVMRDGALGVALRPRSISCLTTLARGTSAADLGQPMRVAPRRLEPSYTEGPDGETATFDFEHAVAWSYWRSSPQTSRIEVSTDDRHDGQRSGRVFYDFTTNEHLAQPEHMIAFTAIELPGPPVKVAAWVKGDGSGHRLTLTFTDTEGEVFSVFLGAVDWEGWRHVEIPVANFPKGLGHWGGDQDGVPTYPITQLGIGLQERADEYVGSGSLCIDDLQITAGRP
jgi:hypothetical protein